jgi:predicted metal-binding membrane protein
MTPPATTSRTTTPLETVLKRDRAVVLAGILLIAGLAWAYTVYLANDMDGMGMAMPHLMAWGAVDWVTMYLMWAVMMVAMMVPTAAPMILMFATVNRRRREQDQPFVPTSVFLSGYALAWCSFAAAATVGNWALHVNSLLDSMMGATTSAYLGGSLLIVAGLFQWSRLKYVCLTHCRSPFSFLMSDWRDGTWGALRMGLHHGAYCLGCCWVLMALLFVMGVMNLVWIAAVAGFVLLEKVAPQGQLVSRATGLALLAWGALMVAGVVG